MATSQNTAEAHDHDAIHRNPEKVGSGDRVDAAVVKTKAVTRHTLVRPIYLAEGSFGRITYFPHRLNVYKTTILGDKESAKRLEHEYEM